MRKIFGSTLFWLGVSFVVVCLSIKADFRSTAWTWFQRSGSFLVLAGAVLSYRSIVRDGVKGVGGSQVLFAKGKIESVDDSGPVQMVKLSYNEKTERAFLEAAIDQLAGYVGAFLLIIGTLIWGYGDLLGKIF